MEPIEIIVIIVASLIVSSVIGYAIYKKIRHKPSSECGACHDRMARALKRMKKDQRKNKRI